RLGLIPKIFMTLSITVFGFQFGGLRSIAQTAPPAWSAPPSMTVVSEEREFQNGDVKLYGTLFMPGGSKPFPAIIAFHSASSATRDLPLYRHLSELMPALGYAVFIFDRRGSGKST